MAVIVLNFGLVWFFIFRLEISILGVALSQALCEMATLGIYLAILKNYGLEETIGFLDSEDFLKNFLVHFWESIKFAFSVAFEAISTEMNLVFVGLLNNTVLLSSYTSFVNYMFIMYSIGVGTSIVIRTRTSYLIGKGENQ